MENLENRVAELFDVSLQQAQTVERALELLKIEREALAAERAELAKAIQFAKAQAASSAQTIESSASGAVERAMRAAMPGLAAQAVQSVENAAKPVLTNLATLGREGSNLHHRMSKTLHSMGWRAFALAATGAAGFLLAGWLSTAYQRSELEELKAGAEAWQAQAGKAKLSTCGDTRRLCVRIDRKAGIYGEDYAVIKGY